MVEGKKLEGKEGEWDIVIRKEDESLRGKYEYERKEEETKAWLMRKLNKKYKRTKTRKREPEDVNMEGTKQDN